MNRREFITLLGAAVAWPLVARAQNGKPPVRFGFVPLGSPSNAYDRSLVEAFQQGLSRVGLIENRDIMLDVAWESARWRRIRESRERPTCRPRRSEALRAG
jgi:hypothetical protein